MTKVNKVMNSVVMFGILILVFLLAYHFIQNNFMITIPQATQEGFQVTTASECNCLPGYIPSNRKGNEKTSFFFCQSLANTSLTKKCY
jgi:hypothetical protein